MVGAMPRTRPGSSRYSLISHSWLEIGTPSLIPTPLDAFRRSASRFRRLRRMYTALTCTTCSKASWTLYYGLNCAVLETHVQLSGWSQWHTCRVHQERHSRLLCARPVSGLRLSSMTATVGLFWTAQSWADKKLNWCWQTCTTRC